MVGVSFCGGSSCGGVPVVGGVSVVGGGSSSGGWWGGVLHDHMHMTPLGRFDLQSHLKTLHFTLMTHKNYLESRGQG